MLGQEVGGGILPRSDRVDSICSTRCPCPVFVGSTSDYLVALTVRPPGADQPLPVEKNDSGTEAVLYHAEIAGRHSYRCRTGWYVVVPDSRLVPVLRFEPLVRSSGPTSYIHTSPWCASLLGTVHIAARIRHSNARIVSTVCIVPPAGKLFPPPSGKVRLNGIGTIRVPTAGDLD
jgi:hypothetical protein